MSSSETLTGETDLFLTSAWFAAVVNFVTVEWWMRRTAEASRLTTRRVA
jgi:hypothetical protein